MIHCYGRRKFTFVGAIALSALWTITAGLPAKEYSYFHEGVLGTSLEIVIDAPNAATAENAEAVVLNEIDRLNLIFSHYDLRSEFSRFVATPIGDTVQLSPELAQALVRCEEWTAASNGAFNPAVQQLSLLWDGAARQGQAPTERQIADAVHLVRRPHWRLNRATSRATRTSAVPLSLNAIAKGIVLDRAAETLIQQCPDASGVMLNLGGDIRVAGTMSAQISVADPRVDALGGQTVATMRIQSSGVATSGNSERGREIEGRHFSHLIDPRDGMPVAQIVSATVVAPDARTADCLATICSVLSIQESLQLCETLPGVSCRLQTAAGDVAYSRRWPASWPANRASVGEVAWAVPPVSSPVEMRIEFEIAKAANAGRYRRPYVAVWIEDQDGLPVRTLCLFLMKDDPGPRWFRDLRRWYAGDQVRKLVEEKDLVATISKPTRNPGKYKLVWDGTSDDGTVLSSGQYTLLIEAAREHGSYQLMKLPFDLSSSFEKELKPNQEISGARVVFRAEQTAQ